MMVAALRREAATRRSRISPSDQRRPVPARLGATSPWKRCSGNGPEWQRMQVLVRSTTSARPRVASAGAPVSDAGIASPTMAYGRSACALTLLLSATRTVITTASGLAKGVPRDRLEPAQGALRFLRPDFARCLDRARLDLDLGELVAFGLINAGQRERVSGRNRVVAGAGQPWRLRRFSREQVHDGGRAGLALRRGSAGGFWDAAGNAGVTNDVNIGHELGRKVDRIDRAPAGVVGGTRDPGDTAGLLRRNDVGDIGGVIAELGDDSVGRWIDRGDPAALRQRD